MKEYRLKSWPELPVAFRRTVYRRLLCALSQRHMPESELRQRSGLGAHEVRSLLNYLQGEDLLDCRLAAPAAPRGGLWRLTWPIHAWMRRPG